MPRCLFYGVRVCTSRHLPGLSVFILGDTRSPTLVAHNDFLQLSARSFWLSQLPRSTSFFWQVTSSMRIGPQGIVSTKSWLCSGSIQWVTNQYKSNFSAIRMRERPMGFRTSFQWINWIWSKYRNAQFSSDQLRRFEPERGFTGIFDSWKSRWSSGCWSGRFIHLVMPASRLFWLWHET